MKKPDKHKKISLKQPIYLEKSVGYEKTSHFLSNRLIETMPAQRASSREGGSSTAPGMMITMEMSLDDIRKAVLSHVKQYFSLSHTASRVLDVVVEHYQHQAREENTVYLTWKGGICGDIKFGFSEYTFKRGLKELLSKELLTPKSPHLFWVNRNVFCLDAGFQITINYVPISAFKAKNKATHSLQIDAFDIA